jgi:hypothetical protein
MYLNGVSTRKVTNILEELCGLEITSSEVSRATAMLDKELDAWRNRSLGESRDFLKKVFKPNPAVGPVLRATPRWFRAGHMALMEKQNI